MDGALPQVLRFVLYCNGMETIAKSDIFFFITSVAVSILTVLWVVISLYIIRIVRDVRDIVIHIKEIGNNLEEEFEGLYTDLIERWPIRLLFKPKRTRRTRSKEE